jgi:glycerophosphoryl diester phosphodiesterase
MQILAHRGYWKVLEEKNSLASMKLAFEMGFGIETDIRDYKGELVISHDIASEESYSLTTLLTCYNELNAKGCLALNIKADGLSSILTDSLQAHAITNYVVFDMSVPETLRYQKAEIPYLVRLSEFETLNPELTNTSDGFWLDAFVTEWYDYKLIEDLLAQNKKLCVVSSELHGRNHEAQWAFIKENAWHSNSKILLCTDFPELAKNYFELYD